MQPPAGLGAQSAGEVALDVGVEVLLAAIDAERPRPRFIQRQQGGPQAGGILGADDALVHQHQGVGEMRPDLDFEAMRQAAREIGREIGIDQPLGRRQLQSLADGDFRGAAHASRPPSTGKATPVM